MKTCSNCGASAQDNSKFCPGCGSSLPAESQQAEGPICANCREPLQEDQRFCGNCGQPVLPPEPAAGEAAPADSADPADSTASNDSADPADSTAPAAAAAAASAASAASEAAELPGTSEQGAEEPEMIAEERSTSDEDEADAGDSEPEAAEAAAEISASETEEDVQQPESDENGQFDQPVVLPDSKPEEEAPEGELETAPSPIEDPGADTVTAAKEDQQEAKPEEELPAPAAEEKASTPAFCPRCGNKLGSQAVFCRNCGHNMKKPAAGSAAAVVPPPPATAPGYQQAAAPPPVLPSYSPPPPPAWQGPGYGPPAGQPPAKKKKGWLVVLIIILVLALVLAGVYILAGDRIRRLLMGNEAKYLEIEGQQLKNNASDLAEMLADVGNRDPSPSKGGMILDFDIQLPDLADSDFAIDPVMQSALENITWRTRIMYDQESSPKRYFAGLDLMTGNEHLLTVEGYYDQEQVIVGLPGILRSYLVAQANMLDEYAEDFDLDIGQAGEAFSMADILLKFNLGLDEPALRQSFYQLVDIMLEHIDEVEFNARQEIQVGQIRASYDQYVVTMDSESTLTMLIEMLQLIRDDQEIYNLFVNMTELSQTIEASQTGFDVTVSMSFQQWQENIDYMIEDLEWELDNAVPFTLIQEVYVDSDERIVGRDLRGYDEDDELAFHFQYLRPSVGNQQALLLRFFSDGQEISLQDIHENDGGRRFGSTVIQRSDQDVSIEVVYRNYERVVIGQRTFILGEFDLTFSGDTSMGLPDRLQYEASRMGDQVNMRFSLGSLGSLRLGYQDISEENVVFPSYSMDSLVNVTDYEALFALFDEQAMNELMRIMDQMGLSPGGDDFWD